MRTHAILFSSSVDQCFLFSAAGFSLVSPASDREGTGQVTVRDNPFGIVVKKDKDLSQLELRRKLMC